MLIAAVLVGTPLLRAQVEPSASGGDPPTSVSGQPTEGEQDEASESDNTIRPDDHALSGGVVPGLGSWGPRHSFLVPGIKLAQSLDSNPMFQAPGVYRGFTTGVGQLQAVQYLGAAAELRYAGAVRFDSSATLYRANIFTNSHAVSVSGLKQAGAWNFSLNDQAHYWQGSLAGDAGMEGMGAVTTQVGQWAGAPGIQLDSVALESGISPDESILAARASRMSNVAVAEMDRRLSNRDVMTATGYYGLLNFFTPGLIDSRQAGMLAGYDHQRSSRDHFGFLYGLTEIDYSGASDSVQTSYGQLMYGRTISGRVAMQAGAGPQHTAITSTAGSYSDLNWQGRGSVNLQLRSASLQVMALRMVTGGSGVLYGARSNELQGSVARRFGRSWSMEGSFAVAQNAAIPNGQTYNTRHGGTSLSSNPSGRFSTFVSYDVQNQSAAGCANSKCALTGTWQTWAVGMGWRTRPIGVQ